MTKSEARKIVMDETSYAFRKYNELHAGEIINPAERMEFVNWWMKIAISDEIAHLAA